MNKDTKLPPYDVEFVLSALSQSQCWSIRNTRIPSTWEITKGKGMTALVIDTGHPVHNDIGDNATPGQNYTDSKTINDIQGHQTHCTGIICAKDNKIGVVGVAPEATCISVKALGDSGGGSTKWLEKALDYAIVVKPDVISMSLGTPVDVPSVHQRVKKLYEMNIPIVCAAGNSGNRGVDYPAKYPETIAIAAFDKNGRIADFSAKGPEVDWAAPGVDIYSTYLNNSYAKLSGTSMACPWVTGIILLMLSKHQKQAIEEGKNDCQTVEQIREHLLKYTIDKGVIGRNNDWGLGVIDAEKLITGHSSPIQQSSSKWIRFKNWIRNLF
jgi:minor extracellular protease Epr